MLAETGGVYITHMRSESDGSSRRSSRSTSVAAPVSRPRSTPKATGRRNWDKIPRAIEMIDEARAEGAEVAANMYPYDGGAPGSRRRFAGAAADGRLLENLRDPEARERIHRELHDPSPGWEPLATLAGPGGVLVGALHREENREHSHRRLDEIAADRGRTGPTA